MMKSTELDEKELFGMESFKIMEAKKAVVSR